MSVLRCPICDEPFDPEASKAMPFCSHRCQQIDLGRWLNEDYGIPLEPEDQDDYRPDPRLESN